MEGILHSWLAIPEMIVRIFDREHDLVTAEQPLRSGGGSVIGMLLHKNGNMICKSE
jgi:hypothetical protein